jgi:hypothetical protein
VKQGENQNKEETFLSALDIVILTLKVAAPLKKMEVAYLKNQRSMMLVLTFFYLFISRTNVNLYFLDGNKFISQFICKDQFMHSSSRMVWKTVVVYALSKLTYNIIGHA